MDALRKRAGRFWVDRWGNIAILSAITLPLLTGFVGLGVETGYWYYQNRRLQASADLAAYAGAVVARANPDATEIVGSAEIEASQHGFDPASGTIQVNWPPTSGSHINSRSVEVVLQQSFDRYFSAVFLDGPISMSARAVASYEPPGRACVLALDETRRSALEISGTARVVFRGCSLMANSLADDAVSIEGSAELTTSCVSSAGGIYNSATLTLEECREPRSFMPRAEDPYADLPSPAIPAICSTIPDGDDIVLDAGKYCGGFSVSGNVSLNEGVYIVSGGTLRINDNTMISGSGVTFYLTDGARVLINGTAEVQLSAPESGPYKGVLFYADRNSPGSYAVFNGTADSSLLGSLYFPSQHVALRGNFRASGGCTRLVARTMDITGDPDFDGDCAWAGLENFGVPGAVLLVE